MWNTKRGQYKSGAGQSTGADIFLNEKLSTSSNTDTSYKSIGIVHHTAQGGINIMRNIGTSYSNIFGLKGFDGAVYQKVRKAALESFEKIINNEQKICDIKMDVERTKQLIILHIVGTIYEKMKNEKNEIKKSSK